MKLKHRGRLHQCTNTTWHNFNKKPISFFFFGIESPLESRAERATKTADQISSTRPLLSSAVVNDSRPSSFPTYRGQEAEPNPHTRHSIPHWRLSYREASIPRRIKRRLCEYISATCWTLCCLRWVTIVAGSMSCRSPTPVASPVALRAIFDYVYVVPSLPEWERNSRQELRFELNNLFFADLWSLIW